MSYVRRTFTKEEIYDLVDDADELFTEAWKWGTTTTYLFEVDGKHYTVPINIHHSDGFQIYGKGVEAIEVKPQERTITVVDWIPVEEEEEAKN